MRATAHEKKKRKTEVFAISLLMTIGERIIALYG